MSDDAPATNLYTALLHAQRSMGKVIKNATNPHLKSKYADLGSVLDTIEQPLWDNGLLIAQRFTHDQGGAILVTELIHAASGERLTSEVPVISKDPTDPQKIGAAITYYRRYSLLALLGLAPEDDDGHAASQPRPQPVPARSQAARPAPPAAAPSVPADSLAMARQHALKQFGPIPATLPEVEAQLAPLAQQVRTNDESLSPGEYQRYHDLEARRKELLADAALITRVCNDLLTPDERWDALWDYYDRATDVADLNRRAEVVKASGVPERDLRAAYKQRHSALAQLLAPVERPASYGG